MTFPVEIMLRGDHRVFVQPIDHPRSPSEWADDDVAEVFRKMLLAIDRVQSAGDATPERPVSLKGLSWIVSAYEGGVVIAFEIHSASAVAGPLAIDGPALEAMIARVVRGGPPAQTVH
jgi:hypothetical protein